jgi:hypothetical protein
MRSVGETQSSIPVLMHHHLATCQPLDLQAQILKTHSVVAFHAAFALQRKNPLQVSTPAGQKGVAPLSRRDLKTLVELGEIVFPQKPIGCFQRSDLAQPQLLRQAALPGREVRSLPSRACGE